MKKTLLITLLAASLSAESCYILTEPTVATYGQDALGKIQSHADLKAAAVKSGVATELKPGTKFCDTKEHNFTWSRKRIDVDGKLLWIDDHVKAEEL